MTITAKIIADSINPLGKRITTWELEYPRLIHSEVMTHRQLSRNAASSRAIPIKSVIEQVKTNPAMPFKFGKNQPGMQAKESLTGLELEEAKGVWLAARDQAVNHATVMADMGLHKQVVNRILEPFQHIKVVMTTTEYENWKWLRLHEDADPTINELARVIEESRNASKPQYLLKDQWHLPYVVSSIEGKDSFYEQVFYDSNTSEVLDIKTALMVSASCCAQVSYRKNDTSVEKAKMIYDRLIESKPTHASPCEHQAQVNMTLAYSGNFRGGWLQYRQTISDNVKLS